MSALARGGGLLSAPSDAHSTRIASPKSGPCLDAQAGFQEVILQPHYRSRPPLHAILEKADPRLDVYPTEVSAAGIHHILLAWQEGLMQPSLDLQPIARSLAPQFQGSRFDAREVEARRSNQDLRIWNRQFRSTPVLGASDFLQELENYLGRVRLVWAEFNLTALRPSGASVRTRARYDLVDAGEGYYLQQRTGLIDLTWEQNHSAHWRLTEWRSLEETRSRSAVPLFEEITRQTLGTNASFNQQLAKGTDHWRTVLDGASGIDIYGNFGVAAGDIDNDGWDDLYICQPSGLPNRLYRNRGDGTFEDVSAQSGVDVLDSCPSALFVDVDNDGREDLIVVRGTGPLLFLNQGGGKFLLKDDAFRFGAKPQGTFTGAACADYDRDGWLDVYFCVYAYYQGLERYRYPVPYDNAQNGPPNFLFRNNRDGTFADSTRDARLDVDNNRFSFACGWCDYNQDGWPDLYVANDFGQKNLYRNNRDGTFTDVAREAGVLDTGAGMSVCWLDYNNDGRQDLYVADMWSAAGLRITALDDFLPDAPASTRDLYRKHSMGNSLFRNNGLGRFDDETAESGSGMGRWAWSSDAWDFDHDGYPDLYITNGMISGPKPQDLSSFFWRQVVARSPLGNIPTDAYKQGWNAINELIRSDGTWSGRERNVLYANNRDGTFTDVSGAAGLDCLEDSRSFALADIDHDGRQELIVKNRSAPQIRIFRNIIPNLGNGVSFRLKGRQSNRDAIGASVTVKNENGEQVRILQAGSGFLAQHSKEVFFGLGSSSGPVRATVQWPGGEAEVFDNLPANHRIDIEEGTTRFHAVPYAASRPRSLSEEDTGAPFASPSTTDHSPRYEARYKSQPQSGAAESQRRGCEQLPTTFETWLLAPVDPPDFSLPDLAGHTRTLRGQRGKPLLLNFWTRSDHASVAGLRDFQSHISLFESHGVGVWALNVDNPQDEGKLKTLAVRHALTFPLLLTTPEVAAIYNLLYRYAFDRRRDLRLPASLLLDESGMIVKIYQGPVRSGRVLDDARNLPRTARERMAKALPFPGTYYGGVFVRNDFTYGVTFAQHGYPEAAEAAFLRAIRNDPGSADAYYDLGTLYMQQQKWDQAGAQLRKAVELQPQDLMGFNNLGVIAARQGRAQEAASYFNRVLQADADNTLAIGNLADLERSEGRYPEAQSLLEKALQRQPDNSQLNYKLGMILAGAGNNAQAETYLKKAVQLQPDNAEAIDNLGVLYVRTGQISRAVEAFSDCIRKAPTFDQSYLNLARVDIRLGKPDEAVAVLHELLKEVPGHPLAREYLERLGR